MTRWKRFGAFMSMPGPSAGLAFTTAVIATGGAEPRDGIALFVAIWAWVAFGYHARRGGDAVHRRDCLDACKVSREFAARSLIESGWTPPSEWHP